MVTGPVKSPGTFNAKVPLPSFFKLVEPLSLPAPLMV